MTEITQRLTIAIADRYRVERHLGEGGMATVYLAEDIKHQRKVALKVLRPELAAVIGAERFVQEITTTASLQHPHILPLFDSGRTRAGDHEGGGEFLYYVMPYVEGETLRDKLNRETQLGIDEAVRITIEIADALDYAHRHGIIHRDIKPENILLHDGHPMVADFGIALALSAAAGGRMTETGLSLGTPHYMSPEQATADKHVTNRSDIYSLGCMLYEMLTGEPPHTGASAQAIIMKIVTESARPVTDLRKSVPPYIAGAIAQALEKLPADRWATAKEFSEALSGVRPVTMSATSSAAAGVAKRAPASRRSRALNLAAWVVAIAGVAGTAYFATRRAPVPALVKFRMELPDSVQVASGYDASVALSRDGTQIAILGDRNGQRAIYVRRMDDPVAQFVRGSESANNPTFSPDGRWLAFRVISPAVALMKVPVGGGTPQKLADSVDNYPASWSAGGTVLYTIRGALWRVSSDGGDRQLVAKPDSSRGISSYIQPDVIPGGRYALVTQVRRTGGIDSVRLGVISLKDGAVTDLHLLGFQARYVAPGRIVFAKAGGLVITVPFSLSKRAVTGPPALLMERVRQATSGQTGFSVSQTGTIAYDAGGGGGINAMYVVDRQGVERVLKGPMQSFREPRVSPDGRRIVVRLGTGDYDGGLRMYDIAAGTLERLTPDSNNVRAEWTRDGLRVVYAEHVDADSSRLVSRSWDGSGEPRVLATGGPLAFNQLSIGPPHGLSAFRRGNRFASGIWLAPTDSLNAARQFIASPAEELSPRVSPNGKLVAYVSNETGSYEVYVREIPGPGARVPVSVAGGTEPMWAAEGSTLSYRGPARMMSASIVEHPLSVSRRDSLFVDIYRKNVPFSEYSVFPNGREFLMLRGTTFESKIWVIVNWTQLIAKPGGTSAEK